MTREWDFKGKARVGVQIVSQREKETSFKGGVSYLFSKVHQPQ